MADKPRRQRRLWLAVVALLAFVLLVRAAAPTLGRAAVNMGLAQLDNYVGTVESVDMVVSRGVFEFEGFTLERREGRGPTFVQAGRITVDIRLRDLLRGHGIVDVWVEEPVIELIWSPDPDRRQLGERLRWAEFFDRLPVAIDELHAERGSVRMQGLGNVDGSIDIEDIEVSMTNMAPQATGRVEADSHGALEVSAAVLGAAPLRGGGSFLPDLAAFSFDVAMNVSDLPLSAANPWLEQIASLDAESGRLELDAELVLADSRLRGRTALVLIGASLADPDGDEGGPFARLWDAIADFGLRLAEDDEGRLGRRFPISAEVRMPERPDLRQVALTLVKACRDGFGRDEDDPAIVTPPPASD